MENERNLNVTEKEKKANDPWAGRHHQDPAISHRHPQLISQTVRVIKITINAVESRHHVRRAVKVIDVFTVSLENTIPGSSPAAPHYHPEIVRSIICVETWWIIPSEWGLLLIEWGQLNKWLLSPSQREIGLTGALSGLITTYHSPLSLQLCCSLSLLMPLMKWRQSEFIADHRDSQAKPVWRSLLTRSGLISSRCWW